MIYINIHFIDFTDSRECMTPYKGIADGLKVKGCAFTHCNHNTLNSKGPWIFLQSNDGSLVNSTISMYFYIYIHIPHRYMMVCGYFWMNMEEYRPKHPAQSSKQNDQKAALRNWLDAGL